LRAYDNVYVGNIVDLQGQVFLDIRDELPGVDEKWFIEKFMRSHIRKMLDIGNFKYALKPPVEIIWDFLEELGGEYERGEEWGGFLPQWVGMVYAMYQWKYNTPSAQLIELLPLAEMERVFGTLHQTGIESGADKLHEVVLGLPPED